MMKKVNKLIYHFCTFCMYAFPVIGMFVSGTLIFVTAGWTPPEIPWLRDLHPVIGMPAVSFLMLILLTGLATLEKRTGFFR